MEKRFWGILGFSVYVFLCSFLLIVPIFYGVYFVLIECGVNPTWSIWISVVLGTATTVAIGAVLHEKDLILEEKEQDQLKYCEIIRQIQSEMDAVCKERDSLERKLDIMERDFNAYLKDTAQSSPWLASKIADTAALLDKELIRQLRSKKNPAIKAAEQVKAISKEKRELLQRSKELEYQLQFYEGLFPWLEEFKTIPAPEAVQYVHTADSDYDGVRFWLSPEEYANLSSAERNQLALDRYMRRKKSDWDVGIEYERYIGYLYENGGYHVTYNGATQGFSDMGRDIIAVKNGETRVIQCKRWAKDKEIHEKHIFQLYGTTVLMRIENGKQCEGVFVTTARLSPLAMSCAKFLKIIVAEELKFKPYPLIKCNISKTGEKIYHLPFDQQYDRVQIFGKNGAMFAWTVAEAEANGFRRAKRWMPEQTS